MNPVNAQVKPDATDHPGRPYFRRLTILGLVALLVVFAVLPGLGLLVAPTVLCITDQTQKADVIIMLGGEDGSRVERAAALFNAHWAPHVIISGEDEMYHRLLVQSGVPEAAIWVDTQAHSTAENARFSIRIMRAHGCKSALIVTSWYHSRRARNCFRHYAPDLAFYVQPTHPSAVVAKRWGSPVPFILKEYPKTIWYWIRYGVSPL